MKDLGGLRDASFEPALSKRSAPKGVLCDATNARLARFLIKLHHYQGLEAFFHTLNHCRHFFVPVRPFNFVHLEMVQGNIIQGGQSCLARLFTAVRLKT